MLAPRCRPGPVTPHRQQDSCRFVASTHVTHVRALVDECGRQLKLEPVLETKPTRVLLFVQLFSQRVQDHEEDQAVIEQDGGDEP